MSRILDARSPEGQALAAEAASGGGLIVLPTDTVYGIGARLDRPAALAALFGTKGRPRSLPLPVLVDGVDRARTLGVFEGAAERLAAAFWPGPLTIVVPRRESLRADIGGDGTTVGVRVPDHAGVRALLELTGPLATTSANRSGEPTPSTVEGVAGVFGDAVAVYLDGGTARGGAPSTVVLVAGSTVTSLREGALAFPDILRALGAA
ncbi:MAG TPA: L-threonylcarbamoyladenylate synthase [Acidimicrobiia bacterium]|nr:L-threonylcarbamoyladenylate synthase [Acidimicrobiia bacterium]